MPDEEKNIDPVTSYKPTDADYEKAEMEQLRAALKRNYKERFLMATTLYKIQQTLKRAKIIHKPYTLNR